MSIRAALLAKDILNKKRHRKVFFYLYVCYRKKNLSRNRRFLAKSAALDMLQVNCLQRLLFFAAEFFSCIMLFMKNVDVPLADIKRRFEPSTEKFFKQYRSLADKWILFNNAGSNPEIIAKKQNAHIEVIAEDLFMKITRKIGIAL